jgi:hypothetical protein
LNDIEAKESYERNTLSGLTFQDGYDLRDKKQGVYQ